jgi:DNA-binding CsgD family transcriptional regulator
VGTLTGVFAKHAGEFSKRLAATGFADALYLRAADAKGVELVLAIPGDAPIRIPATRRLLLSHVASHIKTAYRLRGKSRDFLEDDGDVEAVLSPNGKVEHASGPATERDARSVLRTAALACAKVKSEARAEGDASPLSEWKALFNGRWSVVDHFDNDGKMFILARRNEPDVPQARGLTPRESLVAGLASQGYSNKEIHYEIGLPMSTIASSLTSAILKLGLSSRTELVRVLSAGRRV